MSKSNMKNLDKELMIFHITDSVRDIAIYKQKLLNRIDEIELAPVNPPRRGKKCIVMSQSKETVTSTMSFAIIIKVCVLICKF